MWWVNQHLAWRRRSSRKRCTASLSCLEREMRTLGRADRLCVLLPFALPLPRLASSLRSESLLVFSDSFRWSDAADFTDFTTDWRDLSTTDASSSKSDVECWRIRDGSELQKSMWTPSLGVGGLFQDHSGRSSIAAETRSSAVCHETPLTRVVLNVDRRQLMSCSLNLRCSKVWNHSRQSTANESRPQQVTAWKRVEGVVER